MLSVGFVIVVLPAHLLKYPTMHSTGQYFNILEISQYSVFHMKIYCIVEF